MYRIITSNVIGCTLQLCIGENMLDAMRLSKIVNLNFYRIMLNFCKFENAHLFLKIIVFLSHMNIMWLSFFFDKCKKVYTCCLQNLPAFVCMHMYYSYFSYHLCTMFPLFFCCILHRHHWNHDYVIKQYRTLVRLCNIMCKITLMVMAHGFLD